MGSLGNKTTVDDIARIQHRYDEERFQRYRADAAAQFVDTTRSEKFKHFAADPWYDPRLPQRGRREIAENSHTRFLILGAGFGALLFAVRLVDSGVPVDDITLVDASNGFGGAWYWNRYPGLMCDIESSIYMPLLEETGYVPKHRYSYGTELREHAENIARKWGLDLTVLFRSNVQGAEWDNVDAVWKVKVSRDLSGQTSDVNIRCDFLIMAAGILVHPKLPLIPGLQQFRGHMFHTSRWDYSYTGGSQEKPELTNLQNKKVAIIGTGATAIQVVPELAKWARELYVLQRTPSSVDNRDQMPVGPGEFKKISDRKGWQRERRENFTAFTTNSPEKPLVNLVNDGWTTMPSFSGLAGCPVLKTLPLEKAEDYVIGLHALDLPRQERIRNRVDEIVLDRATAESLKPWYPGWCKRPCFHDDYLPAFNRHNVHLIDTRGKGVDKITEHGLSFDGQHYDVDLIIFSTGFEPWGAGSPAHRAGMKITGRDGLDMDEKWAQNLGTFQGLFTRNFPNLILPGGTQAAPAANQVHMMDLYASHIAKIIQRAQSALGQGQKPILEPTEAGENDWVKQIISRSHGLATLINCTPSYLTNEAKLSAPKSHEEQLAMARRAPWTPGLLDYTKEIESWLAKDNMPGLEVRSVPFCT